MSGRDRRHPFEVRTERAGDDVRLLLSGELDIGQEGTLRERVGAVLAEDQPDRLVVDVRGVRFVDSSGLRGLMLCRNDARSRGVPFALAVAPGPVSHLLDVTGVRDAFDYD